MVSNGRHQQLPASGPEREALREKGQFWTPAWVAEAMVAYAIGGGSDHIFDPAVGAGAFFRAAVTVAAERGRPVRLLGAELHREALDEAARSGLTGDDLAHVQITDFVLHPPNGQYQAIVANPPYIRHHRLPATTKAFLKEFSTRLIGKPLDGRTGFHVYFLLRALERLELGGRLAFIMPADTCEGVFAPRLWKWITSRYRLDAVITFEPAATPFPGVDTNALVFMIRHEPPARKLHWARCAQRTWELRRWTQSSFTDQPATGLNVEQRDLSEALSTGLSRPPQDGAVDGRTLLSFAKTSRGIATGANDFFFLTSAQVDEIGIPDEFLVRALGRTRDVDGDLVTGETLQNLDARGRPTWLFAPDGRPLQEFPRSVQDYLLRGEDIGLPGKALIGMRNPWYKMERRAVPPFLFAYLGRRNARFIRNEAGVVPLTGFLCVYPHSEDPGFIEKLWEALSRPETVENLRLVGKSYGGGSVKVEPRGLERLVIPSAILAEVGLEVRDEEEQGVLL